MTLLEFLIALMSIFFIFDSATIHIINIPFTILLIIYISSIIEIFVISVVYEKKIKGRAKSDKY
jgi:hypothetical protein